MEQRFSILARLFETGQISLEEISALLLIPRQDVELLLVTQGILKTKTLLVGGGAGFIGSNFIHHILEKYPQYRVINYDKLTYAGNLENLRNVEKDPRYMFVQGDIADTETVEKIIKDHNVEAIVNFAAESHVGRSVMFRADEFVRTNVLGVHSLLEAVKRNAGQVKTYLQISTDETYGTLSLTDTAKFTEDTGFTPNVPYAAAKAGGDLLCRAYFRSYEVPVIVTHCSNNYGPYQHPEKLIPNSLFRALRNQPIMLHGAGQHVRDWIYVRDHCEALDCILQKGKPGEVYNIGSDNEKTTYEIAKIILSILGKPESLITLVPDRPGNDLRYSIDTTKIREELGWEPKQSFEEGIAKTIQWYQHNIDWVERIREKDKEFSKYI
ncbi:MAG: dTDP-glucose 4,6-dehydratase [Candidatus Spechtbacteria bacterium]|nr:dTDP-glucose 4,6-dehydratase [Candidatus Spechtbacteria bacterium]